MAYDMDPWVLSGADASTMSGKRFRFKIGGQ